MVNNTGLIYKITSPSGKMYIGQTIGKLNRRLSRHATEPGCVAMKRAMDKYGRKNMKCDVIEENIPLEQLDDREMYWIDQLNTLSPNGYNLNTGGGRPVYSEETKERLREVHRTRKLEKDGYLGNVHMVNNRFMPRLAINAKEENLSHHSFETREEAVNILIQYTEDPDNFIKPGTPIRKQQSGTVYFHKTNNQWVARAANNTHVGLFDTKEDADQALDKYNENGELPPAKIRPRGSGTIEQKYNGKWRATVCGVGIGTFDTKEEAEHGIIRYKETGVTNITYREGGSGTVTFDKKTQKWRARSSGGKYVGTTFITKEDAEQALDKYNENGELPPTKIRPSGSGTVYFNKTKNRWAARTKEGKYIGAGFLTEDQARSALDKYLISNRHQPCNTSSP
tara:strand:+ start:2732 stop:3919 length:1188 start_codon:yes stop_codon:yes gene_type:complete